MTTGSWVEALYRNLNTRVRRKRGGRLARLSNLIAEGYVEFDRDLRFIYVNGAAERLMGHTAAEALGRTPAELFAEERAALYTRRLTEVWETGCPTRFEDHQPQSCIRVRAERADDVVAVLFADIAELRRRDEALQQETELRKMVEERFEAALSVNQLVVFTMDRDLRYSWVYNNQIAVRDVDAVGKTPSAFFDTTTAPRLVEFFSSVIRGGIARRAELALRPWSSNKVRHFVTSARPTFGADRQVSGLTGASIDITNLVEQREELAKAREAAYIAKAEAERASLSKSKFFAAASHDLRQPVQSLLLLISLLKSQLKDAPAEKVVDQMNQAVDALRILFDSMLDVSRLDAGVIVPAVQMVRLGPLLERLTLEYRLRAEEARLSLRVVPTSACCRSDPVLLERVLRNLLENALRYCPKGRLLVGCRRRGPMVRIDVIDTGIGIAREHLEVIFDEFHQVGNAARNRRQGLGLGLSIVKRIMRLLGGTVEVRSTPGRGSCFSVAVPLTDETAVDEALPTEGAEGGGRLVLVIEDDDVLRHSLGMMLANWGYRAEMAASGEEALDMVAGVCRPDAIVSDYRLSNGLTGTDTLLLICRILGEALPCLIITGDTAPERVREVHGSGFRILHKPVGAEDLRRALASMLSDGSRQAVNSLA